MKIRFAVTPPRAALEDDAFPDYLDECERLGFDTVWLSDIPLGALGDPLISLTFAAAHTSRLKLGANLVPLGRHPLWFRETISATRPDVKRTAAGYRLFLVWDNLRNAARSAIRAVTAEK